VQLMIWFALYVVLVLALATWRDHHDTAARTRKRRHPGKGPVVRQPARAREQHRTG
jgi:hypothetical protein